MTSTEVESDERRLHLIINFSTLLLIPFAFEVINISFSSPLGVFCKKTLNCSLSLSLTLMSGGGRAAVSQRIYPFLCLCRILHTAENYIQLSNRWQLTMNFALFILFRNFFASFLLVKDKLLRQYASFAQKGGVKHLFLLIKCN